MNKLPHTCTCGRQYDDSAAPERCRHLHGRPRTHCGASFENHEAYMRHIIAVHH